MHRVVALCLEGVVAFDLAAPAQAFSVASTSGGKPQYEFSTCSLDGGELASTTGFGVVPEGDLGLLERADTVVVPAYFDVFSPPSTETIAALRAAAERGARVISVFGGAFALAPRG